MITSKIFEIRQWKEGIHEFVVEETFYVYNFVFRRKYHFNDKNVPYYDYFRAKEKKKQLEKLEKTESLKREGSIVLTIVSIGLIVMAHLGHKYL